ncbi:helix-turn-helix domain-containing protein [Alteromonas lipolytica]|uniref:XRE family transcriptional regulator n=1 Tax=Alteromonas lipolytica TaxID=1856405 RepID=A0A1E8FJ21_9ALTE|nr:XRE family transcriptional regulator [Alteromonas lipolytica]OFI35746.1 XRE family transcriptional regulator [Alteromonas lipolytica]GGF80436.1 XRE family transcriptional regulator [Alteromonas lipolytica]
MDKSSLLLLGQHLQQLRHERGLSLSQLAADAGIAKSNLSRLEQGNGNPTLDTIWRLAVQLNVPFSALVAPVTRQLDESGIEVRLIDQGQDNPGVDAYWMSIAPDMERIAEAHGPGTSESITLIRGELEVGTMDKLKRLTAGETCTFVADQPHLYRTAEHGAAFLITIIYHKVTAHD